MVNFSPISAMMSRVSKSTAVSGSHMPSGFRPKCRSKSLIPHRTWVYLSRLLASGIMMWLYAWASAEPCPENFCWLSLSASMMV